MTAVEMVKQKLEQKGISQAELARQIGCDPSYVNRYLKGRFCISDGRVRSFCHALGLNIRIFRTAVRIQNCQNEHLKLQLKYRDVWEEAMKWK